MNEKLFDLLDESGRVVQLDEKGQIPFAPDEDLIPLKEWARMNGISPATARQKAGRGSLKTARKVGRDWMVSAREVNPDHRVRQALPEDGADTQADRVLWGLRLLDRNTMLDIRDNAGAHAEYCRNVFFKLRKSLSGNTKILFDLICDAMDQNPQSDLYFIPHEVLISNLQDEAFEGRDSGAIDFTDYLKALSNIAHDLMAHTIDLEVYKSSQTVIMSWYRSVSWINKPNSGLHFVPSSFFRLIFYGLGR